MPTPGWKVLKDATAQAIADAKALLAAGKVSVKIQEPCNEILFSRAKVWNGEKWACVTIVGGHTNIVHIETHNGVVFTNRRVWQKGEQESPLTVLSRTTLAEILKFVNEVPFAAIRFILDSAKLNCALSQEGLSGKWGAAYWRDAGKTVRARFAGERSLFIHCDSYQRGIRCAYGRRYASGYE